MNLIGVNPVAVALTVSKGSRNKRKPLSFRMVSDFSTAFTIRSSEKLINLESA